MESLSSRIPILQIEDFLVASVQASLHDRAAMEFKDDLLQRIHETKAQGLILDFSALDIVDSFIAKLTGDIAEMSALMGARVVVTGLQPAVAVSLVELGVELRGVSTALNLEKGIRMLRQRRLDESPQGGAGRAQSEAGRGLGQERHGGLPGPGSGEGEA
jgi:rsbT antagonist protein RsbS